MSPAERLMLRVIAAFVFGAAMLFGVRYVLNLRDENQQLRATVDGQGKTATATGAISGATGSALDDRQRLDIVVTQAGAQYGKQYEELKREDQTVRDWSAGAIPQRVRDLAHSRRLARDGSGSHAVGSKGFGSATGTTGSNPQP